MVVEGMMMFIIGGMVAVKGRGLVVVVTMVRESSSGKMELAMVVLVLVHRIK